MSQINIGGLIADKFYLGSSDSVQIYLGSIKLYPQTTPPTPPTPSSCYEVIPQSISQYSSTTYDSVYSWTDGKWYIKNNLSQYEEYGVYDIVADISSATTYDGKLAVVGTTEYQYSGGSWVVVGTYEDSSTTYEITDEDPYEYEGVELSTTFKIPYADVEAVGWVNLRIRDNNSSNLQIELNTGGMAEYTYQGSSFNEGTITNDGEYFYLSLPSEAPQSIVIDSIDYWNSTPIHLIVGSKQASVEYVEKTAPSSALTYSSVAQMEAVTCPTVGVGQYCYTNGQAYKYTSNNEWVSAQDSELLLKSFNSNGEVSLMGCGYKGGEVSIDNIVSGATDIWIGDCITKVNDIFNGLYDTLSAVTIQATTPPTLIDNSVKSSNLSTVSVPCSSVHSYRTTKFWNKFSNNIVSSEPNCQTTEYKARLYGYNGNLLVELPRSSSLSGENISSAETQQYSSTTYSVEFGDCFSRVYTNAFKGFKHLTSVTIPNNVISFGNNVFNGCTSLRSITLDDNYNSYISSGCFNGCTSLQSITIPSGTTAIDSYVFSGCTSLQSITILKTNGVVELWNANALTNTNNCPIYVPSNLVNSYKSASNWSTYASRIRAIPNS